MMDAQRRDRKKRAEPWPRQPFSVGDRVTTTLSRAIPSDTILIVTTVRKGMLKQINVSSCWGRVPESGWWVAASSPPCPTCGHVADETREVDSTWFHPSKPKKSQS